MQVTDDMVEAAAKKLYEMRHLTRWEALGERSQDIYRVEARAMLRTAADLSDKQAGEVKAQDIIDRSHTIVDDVLDMALYLRDCPRENIWQYQDAANRLAAFMNEVRSALVDVPAVEPTIPTANCCVCGRIIDTREKSEGGDDFGDETEAGKWTCSVQCYDAYVGFVPDEPAPLREGEDSAEASFMTLVSRYGDAPTQEGFDQIYRRYLSDCERAATRSGSATTAKGGAE